MALTTTPYLDTFDSAIENHWEVTGNWSAAGGKAVTDGVGNRRLSFVADTKNYHSQGAFNFNDEDGEAILYARFVDDSNYIQLSAYSYGALKVINNRGGTVETLFTQNGIVPSIGDFTLGIRCIDDDVVVYYNGNSKQSITLDPDELSTGFTTHFRLAGAGTAVSLDDVRIALSDAAVTTLSGGVAFPAGAVAATSSLLIETTDNLPASGILQWYAHKVSDKTVMSEGTAEFTNGDAQIDLSITDFPVATSVDWFFIDTANNLVAGARQNTVDTPE